MIIAGLVLAGLAAAVHVWIFWLEAIAWTRPAGRRVFGTSREQAAAGRELAFNQGFYNLFLVVLVAAGIVATCLGARAVGATLVFAGTGSMVAAAIVLVLANRRRAAAAAVQGVAPALAIVLLAIGLAG